MKLPPKYYFKLDSSNVDAVQFLNAVSYLVDYLLCWWWMCQQGLLKLLLPQTPQEQWAVGLVYLKQLANVAAAVHTGEHDDDDGHLNFDV